MKLDIRIHSSANLRTKEDMARILRAIADQIEDAPCDRIDSVLYDRTLVRVGHLTLTGAAAP